jgi:hypothetical protein
MVGSTRVLSYEDIVGVQKKRDINEVGLKRRRVDSFQSNTCMSYRKDIT